MVKMSGGKAYKFVSPGNSGVPDRIVAFPLNIIVFVELKRPGCVPTEKQEIQIAKLKALGCNVEVVDSIEGVYNLVRRYSKNETTKSP
ncbi:VRR-NUC domain protein [compost metagenome]